jgi:hypothetical protein
MSFRTTRLRIPKFKSESLEHLLVVHVGRFPGFCLHLVRRICKVHVEQEPMSKCGQHIVVGLLLVSYLFVGSLARLESFGKLIALGAGPAKVERHQPTRPMPAKICWTQYKHIPSFVKVTLLSSALITALALTPLEFRSLLPVSSDVSIILPQENATSSSRAPPLHSAIS